MSFIIIQEIMSPTPKPRNKSYVDNIYFQYSQVIDGVPYGWCSAFSHLVGLSSLFNVELSKLDIDDFLKHLAGLGRHWSIGGPIYATNRRITRNNPNKSRLGGLQSTLLRWNKKFPQYEAKGINVGLHNSNVKRAYKQGLPIVVVINHSHDWLSNITYGSGIIDRLKYDDSVENIRATHAICIQNTEEGGLFLESTGSGKTYKIPDDNWIYNVKGVFAQDKVNIILPAYL